MGSLTEQAAQAYLVYEDTEQYTQDVLEGTVRKLRRLFPDAPYEAPDMSFLSQIAHLVLTFLKRLQYELLNLRKFIPGTGGDYRFGCVHSEVPPFHLTSVAVLIMTGAFAVTPTHSSCVVRLY